MQNITADSHVLTFPRLQIFVNSHVPHLLMCFKNKDILAYGFFFQQLNMKRQPTQIPDEFQEILLHDLPIREYMV